MIEMFKHRPKPWGQMNEDEQKDLVYHIEYAAKRLVRTTIGRLASQGRPSVRCKLDSYGESAGIKLALSLSPLAAEESGAAVLFLHGNVRKEVLIVAADAEQHYGADPAATDADQRALQFESDRDPEPPATEEREEAPAAPADDSDLNPDGDQSPAIVDQVSAAAEAARAKPPSEEDSAEKRFGVHKDGRWLGNVKGGWGGIDTAQRFTEEDAQASAEQFGAEVRDLTAPAPAEAAGATDDGDPSFGVYDPDDKMWLEADKEYWAAEPEKAGRWSEVRAKQIATEMGLGAEARELA